MVQKKINVGKIQGPQSRFRNQISITLPNSLIANNHITEEIYCQLNSLVFQHLI